MTGKSAAAFELRCGVGGLRLVRGRELRPAVWGRLVLRQRQPRHCNQHNPTKKSVRVVLISELRYLLSGLDAGELAFVQYGILSGFRSHSAKAARASLRRSCFILSLRLRMGSATSR